MANQNIHHLVTKLVILIPTMQNLFFSLDLDKPFNLLSSILSTVIWLDFIITGTESKNSSKQASDVPTGAGVCVVCATDFLHYLIWSLPFCKSVLPVTWERWKWTSLKAKAVRNLRFYHVLKKKKRKNKPCCYSGSFRQVEEQPFARVE